MKRFRTRLLILVGALVFATAAHAYDCKVVDAKTKEPIKGALVTLSDLVVHRPGGHFPY